MDSPELERKLAAILSADVAGYSRLLGEDEQATIRTLQAYRAQVAQLVEGHRGRVVDTPGDNLLAEFPSALEAVSSAVEIQRELRASNAGLAGAHRMEFRIGIHMGDVSSDGERLYGDGVNIAARLEAMADAGGICVSDSVQAQARGRIPVSFEDQGEHDFENIADPVRVYRVRLDVPETVVQPPEPRRHGLLWSALAGVGLASVVAALLWLAWPR